MSFVPKDEPIAIIGVGCRFPGGVCDLDSYWELLLDGRDATCEIPEDRWNIRKFFDPNSSTPGRTNVCRAGFLSQSVDKFDFGFFGISPREAAQMDPQQRFLLEVMWEALEESGLCPRQLRGTNTGVYIGGFLLDNLVSLLSPLNRAGILTHTATSATMSMLSNRISHIYDFRGPSLSVDTACSSSLLSLHLACQGLRAGDCELDVAGGVNLLLRPEPFVAMTKSGFLAPDGRCKTFDVSADGYARGEGVGLLILKPLGRALEDRDTIHSVILASGVNQDGRTPGITLPNSEAQAALLKRVLKRAGVHSDEVAFVEAHGTGTQAGDKAEVSSLSEVFSSSRQEPVWVGAVKTNIGHLEAAAGVASVIKTALVLKNRQVPPNLNLINLNPELRIEETVLALPQKVESVSDESNIAACINGFGYGGSNACIVMGAPPKCAPRSATAKKHYLLPVTAATPQALEDRRRQLADFLESNPETDLSDLGYTLGCCRSHLGFRSLTWGGEQSEVASRLRIPVVEGGSIVEHDSPGLIFLYTGMGSQWFGMGDELRDSEPEFSKAYDECDNIWKSLAGSSLKQPSGSGAMMDPIDAQPANLALQISLTKLLRSKGVHPQGILGHSVGEVAAAWAAGVLSLEDAFKLCFCRASLQQKIVGSGTMLAVGLSAEELEEWLSEYPDLEIAAINATRLTVLAGSVELLSELERRLETAGLVAKLLKVSVPYHSSFMEPLEHEFKSGLQGVEFSEPQIPLYSTVLGTRVKDEILGLDYWWDNVRKPVSLNQAMTDIVAHGYEKFLQVGPHPALTAAVRDAFSERSGKVLVTGCLHREEPEIETFYSALQSLFCGGLKLDWSRLYPDGNRVSLPNYPWSKEQLWAETSEALRDRIGESNHPLVERDDLRPGSKWKGEFNSHWHPFLAHHQVAGEAILPAAAYAEIFLAAAIEWNSDSMVAVEHLKFVSPLNPLREPRFELEMNEDSRRVTFHSAALGSEGEWALNCTGLIGSESYPAPEPKNLESMISEGIEYPDISSFYARLRDRGLDYGQSFQTVKTLWVSENQVVAKLALDEDLNQGDFYIHPCLLDGAFHSLFALFDGRSEPLYIPVALQRLRVFRARPNDCYVRASVCSRSEYGLTADLELLDNEGNVLVDVQGLKLTSLGKPTENLPESNFELAYSLNWMRQTLVAERPPLSESWSVWGAKSVVEELGSLGVKSFNGDSLSQNLIFCVQNDEETLGLTGCGALLELLQQSSEQLRKLVVVTQNAHQVQGWNSTIHPGMTAIWGFSRVVAQEFPEIELRMVDHDGLGDWPKAVAEEVLWSDGNAEVAYRNGRRWVHRLSRYEKPSLLPSRPGQAYYLNSTQVGLFDSLEFQEKVRREPGPEEVEIDVRISAVNFKDIMKILGLLDHDYLDHTYFGHGLGMECAGIITAIGRDVTGFLVGDKVAAVAPDGLSNFLTVPAALVVPCSLELELGVQHLNFIAAYRGLVEVGCLSAGQTVLVHGAAGGVGLAAIELCRRAGATVIATVGSQEKRDYLRSCGLEYISDSRSLAFYDDVREWTRGQGVDLVLNSLSGEFMRKSLQLLKNDGCFVEVGKRDITEGRLMNLGVFARNQRYAAIDIDTMISDNRSQFQSLLHTVNKLLSDKLVKPLPSKLFPTEQAAEALRYVAKSKHIGKVAIDFSSQSVPIRPQSCEFRLDPFVFG